MQHANLVTFQHRLKKYFIKARGSQRSHWTDLTDVDLSPE